jgi:NTP pyrophosphatase (non-canonical NTP hydrolase)
MKRLHFGAINWSIVAWQAFIERWSAPIFTQSTTESTLSHFEKEVEELRRAHDAEDRANIVEECADNLIMLIQYCNQRKINLGQALFDKMQINLNREWLPPDEDGIVFHKKEAE